MDLCIWCLNEPQKSNIEHIFPEAMGCPSNFVIDSQWICQKCNNKLGHLDRTVCDDFDFPTFINGIPRKQGRPPAIHSRGNVKGGVGPRGFEISFNMDPHSTLGYDGSHLPGFRSQKRDVKATLTHEGLYSKVQFTVKLGQDPKFIRGIYKIAFSTLTFFLKNHEPYKAGYDSIRDFVINGKGVRSILMLSDSEDDYRHNFLQPELDITGDYIILFRLAMIWFIVDLSPTGTMLSQMSAMADSMFPGSNWTILPTAESRS